MRLKEYLYKTGIPVSRFAKRCNLTYPQVRHIIIDHSPTLETALRIAKYTEGEVSPRELLKASVEEEIYGKEDKEKESQKNEC